MAIVAGAPRYGLGETQRRRRAAELHSRMRAIGQAVGHRVPGDRGDEDRPRQGALERQSPPHRPRSAQQLPDIRGRRRRDRRLRQGRGGSVACGQEAGTYPHVEAEIGGKIAQLGQRLIVGAPKKIADEFFAKFALAVRSA